MGELRRHLAGHRVLYVLGAAWLLAVVVVPTSPVPLRDQTAISLPPEAGAASPGVPTTVSGVAGPEITSLAPGTVAGTAPAPTTAGSPAATELAGGPGTPLLSRLGVPCGPGVPQLATASYAPPCVPAFTGPNGGATARGVSETEIRLVVRTFADNPFAGAPPSDADRQVVQVFVDHLNDTFELYGRRVVLDYVESAAGDPLQEAQGRGRDGACQDAVEYAQERQAFGVVESTSTPFVDCAAEQGLVVFQALGRQSERLMARRHPYLWTSQRGCERLASHLVEFAGRRLLGHAASLGGAAVQDRERRLGFYVPDNETYQPCIGEALDRLEGGYGHRAERFDYTPDVARLADQALLAVNRFRAAGVTTVMLTCDDLSVPLLMAAADLQGWEPEWVLSGLGSQGIDSVARTWPRRQVAHVFGLSEYPVDSVYNAADNEAAEVYRAATGQALDPAYYPTWATAQQVFRLLQAAGPNLTPESLGAGALSLPEVSGDLGRWSYRYSPTGEPGQASHSALLDATEVFWDPEAVSIDGETGAFRAASGGARFAIGEWPAAEFVRG